MLKKRGGTLFDWRRLKESELGTGLVAIRVLRMALLR